MKTFIVHCLDDVFELEADYYMVTDRGLLFLYDNGVQDAHTVFRDWVCIQERVTIH